MKIKKNDKVVVIAGNDKGKTGKVLKVFPKNNRVIIEGINIRKKHTKPSQKNPQGGILEIEAPINASNGFQQKVSTWGFTRISARLQVNQLVSRTHP